MKRFLLAFFLSSLGLAAAAAPDAALPFLSPLIGEHMMFQRDRPNAVWGWTTPGAEVRVTIAGRQSSGLAGSDGRWQAAITPPAAGGPYTLTIDGPQHVELKDVLVGDIWLCSGQSNMEFSLAHARGGEEDAKNSANPAIRLFHVAQKSSYTPALTPQGEWQLCGPSAFKGFGGFSAVAYYFARQVNAETGVPVGLIEAAIGGTPAESWMSPEALQSFPEFAPGLAEIARLRDRGAPVYGNYVMHWYDDYDRGVAGHWSGEIVDEQTWVPASLHDVFAKLGVPAAPAVVWLRRELNLPDPLPAGVARVLLGIVEKMDTVWINGQQVGASAWVENPRAYPLRGGVLRPGRNQITIRVLKTAADGGFRSPPETLRLQLGDLTVPLEDGWRATLGADARPPHPLPLGYENWPTMPTVLHLGMLRPLGPVALRGALWYQGEANFSRAAQYRTLLPAMIKDWRTQFNQPDLPFYIVSLPAFMKRRDQPGSDGWTDLREAQMLTARTVPHTGVVITVDTGDADNIHPIDKRPVGERLAWLALRDLYGKKVVSQGPTFTRAEVLPGSLRVHFEHTEGGLAVKGDKLGEFSVAGADRVWHWAEARIDGETVVVSSPDVSVPVAARYAWQANPLATLFNGAGLPAAPFRTDDWSVTEPKKL